jgi:hypothetical protein
MGSRPAANVAVFSRNLILPKGKLGHLKRDIFVQPVSARNRRFLTNTGEITPNPKSSAIQKKIENSPATDKVMVKIRNFC